MRQRSEKKWQFSPSGFVLIIGIVMVIGFGLGMRSDVILSAIAPAFGIKVASGSIDLSSVQETYRVLKGNFDGDMDTQKLIEGANRGLVEAAGDQYTVFMSEEEAKEFENDLSGKIAGIGAEIGLRDNKPTIIRTLKDTPAQTAGLQANDVIAGVNDENSLSWTVDETVSKIRGKDGTTVKITVLRGNQTQDFTITRANITSPSVESKIEGDTGILTIARFDDTTSQMAKSAAEEFKAKGVSKVILDLRGNGGGYLIAAQEVAGLWLANKVVVSERTDGKVTEELKTGSDAPLEGIKTVVLVNGGSASASEIVAGALKDHKAATLVGEKTYGKGSVQKIVNLRMNAQLKVTVAKWYTPNGVNINKEGISPDQKVELSREDSGAGRDPQLDAARQALQ